MNGGCDDIATYRTNQSGKVLFLVALIVLGVDFGHECLEFGSFAFGDGWLVVVVVVILEYLGEHIGDGLALGVAHGVDGGVGALGYELVLQAVALAVATDDAAGLPEGDVVEELAAGDANLANEQLVEVVGGQAFFRFLPPLPLSGLSSGSPAGTW